eukprot:COSAG06_NODE_1490_length_9281_cov_6.074820_1_plen_69_part_00
MQSDTELIVSQQQRSGATLDVSWQTKLTTTASSYLDSVKVDILQHLIEPRNVDRRQLVPALPLRTCRV